ISMAGGKLTGYRKMAEQVVDKIVYQMREEENILYSKSETKHLTLSGGDVGGSSQFPFFYNNKLKEAIAIGIEEKKASRWLKSYGSNIDILFQYFRGNHELAISQNLHPCLFAELLYGLEHELVYHPADFFIRRTGAVLFDIDM